MNLKDLLNKINQNISCTLVEGGDLFPELREDATLDRGKRLRARVFFAFSKDTGEKPIKIATAIELLHAATLIHDDILDNARLRRGRAAFYTKHGIPTSLLYGDYLFSSAFSLIAEVNDPRIHKEMTEALREVLKGEILEHHRRRDTTLTKKEYLSIIKRKSGALFGIACKLGAMMRGLDEKDIERSHLFGISAGVAYQITDDYFDYFGQDSDKDKFKDLQEGFVTLPLIYLLEACSGSEKEAIVSILNDKSPAASGIKRVGVSMERYNVSAKVTTDIKDRLAYAAGVLPKSALQGLRSDFDILSWIGDRIKDVQKEYCDSGWRIRRA